MKLDDLLQTLKIGTNHCSVNLIENLKDCQRKNYLYVCWVFDRVKFEDWCLDNKIICRKVEVNSELVYRLIRFN